MYGLYHLLQRTFQASPVRVRERGMLDDALQQQLVARHSLHGANDVAAHGAQEVLLMENSGA